jgi:hypothetical protein
VKLSKSSAKQNPNTGVIAFFDERPSAPKRDRDLNNRGLWVEDDFELVGDGEDAAVERRKKLSQLSLGGHH